MARRRFDVQLDVLDDLEVRELDASIPDTSFEDALIEGSASDFDEIGTGVSLFDDLL